MRNDETPEDAIAAGRFILWGESEEAFAVWRGRVAVPRVKVEGQVPEAWVEGLRARGHVVEVEDPFSYWGGHAHAIQITQEPTGRLLRGAADPRVRNSDAIAL
jgi:gamma-glutamyltranspeptidase